MLQEEVPTALLALVQQRLAALLGPRYTVALCGSGDGQYHLAIQPDGSGLSLEDSGSLSPGFAERLLALGRQLKAMLESDTFKRMASNDPSRPLVWISDPACRGLRGRVRPAPRPGW
ncbi:MULTISPECIES: hypothetical protein [unclassified Pseudomonas]|uniref:hypothetical protein n=1 Tax=unclassified Pseudomonas TaxID=196821 RepID=UPI0037FAC20E